MSFRFLFYMSCSFALNTGLTIGSCNPIRVNCNFGANSLCDYDREVKKIIAISKMGNPPDMMMDLSLCKFSKPLYTLAKDNMNVSLGTVLSYIPFSKKNGLDWNVCFDYLEKLCSTGISFVTIHFTADLDLFQKKECVERIIPMSSRGGGICLFDQRINNRKTNIFLEHIDEIAAIVKKYNVAVSLGTTFRPACIFDALDSIHLKETSKQMEICRYLQSQGVNVIVENIGHIALNQMEKHRQTLQQMNAPIMPLGPIPTDYAKDMDHVAAAIGSSFAAYWNVAHIINCVTRFEHSESKIDIDATLEAVEIAQLVAHIVNVSRGCKDDIDKDMRISRIRSENKCCLTDVGDCSRCLNCCPLKIMR